MKRCIFVVVAVLGCRAPRPPVAELWGAGLFSTGAWDFFVALSPAQDRALFGRADDAFERYTLYETRRGADGAWSAPVVPRFARAGDNADPHLSPDGRTVVFISNRDGAAYDIWTASLDAGGAWGEARRLPPPVNGPEDAWSPALAASGNLYFGAERAGTRGGSDLWVARLVDGEYRDPENLGDAINTPAHEVEPWISPDERTLIFAALRRADGVGGYDLFASRRGPAGWARARPLGGGVNTPANEWNHSVSPDGAWLYFTSNRAFAGRIGERFDVPRDDRTIRGLGNGKGDMYRIPMRAVLR